MSLGLSGRDTRGKGGAEGRVDSVLTPAGQGGTRVEMATDLVLRTPTAKEVTAGHRLYGIAEGALLYAQDMAAVGQGMSPHLSARLIRVGG